jgi:hypothetical protein
MFFFNAGRPASSSFVSPSSSSFVSRASFASVASSFVSVAFAAAAFASYVVAFAADVANEWIQTSIRNKASTSEVVLVPYRITL